MEAMDSAAGEAIAQQTVDAHAVGFEPLAEVAADVQALRNLLTDLSDLADDGGRQAIGNLDDQLIALVPSVTMIGQVKAGKTSLVNAMIGRPEFLPADVNPWTSVVTSIHLNTKRDEEAPAASFQLFKKDEWDNLVNEGGRLGELSRRAKADEELKKVHAQIEQVRDKTRQRLGRKFELLLGQKHDYGTVTEELIQRYVCMGDDLDLLEGEDDQQGRFADITKSADVYFDSERLPMPLCIRDTPGVNDTFLMREQITINALRSSRLCVVVLSAHQALTTTDMAMIRMISNVKSRDLVIFVNRIDELSDPVNQVDEIRASILSTLEKHNGPKDVELVFGSAYWANLAVGGTLHGIVDDSADAMLKWAEKKLGTECDNLSPEEMVWRLSGVPDLFRTLGNRIADGEAGEVLHHVRSQAKNAAAGLQVSSAIVSVKMNGGAVSTMSRDDVEIRLNQIRGKALETLGAKLDQMSQQFSSRIEQSHRRFLDRALEALLQHLENDGEDKVWQYSADGLRVLLRSSFLVLSRKYASECDGVFADVANQISTTYRDAFEVTDEGFGIEPPSVPVVPAPIALGTTIALDLNTSWWKGWWQRRRGYRNYADGYYDLIEAETAPLIRHLDAAHLEEIRENAVKTLQEFLEDQGTQLLDICDQTAGAAGAADRGPPKQDRDSDLANIIDDLSNEQRREIQL